MAYVRKEEETVDFAFALNKVWAAIPKALANLDWEAENIDDNVHNLKTRTKASIISWGTVMLIHAESVDEKTTRINVSAETAVTTFTSVFTFGQTSQRIELFFKELLKQLKPSK